MNYLAPILFACLLSACAGHRVTSEQVIRTITPESVSFGVTAPNLFAGPIVANKGNNSARRDSVGQIGGTISFTYRLKPLRVERAEVQPARVVRAVPVTSEPPNTPDVR